MNRRQFKLSGIQIRANGAPRKEATLTCGLGFMSDKVEITAADKEAKTLPKIAMLVYTGAAINQPWSFDPVVINLEGIELPVKAEDVPFLLGHDPAKGIGHATRTFMDAEGVHLEGVASRATPERDEVVQSSAQGYPWKASIGCGDLVAQYIDEGTTLSANGREFPGPVVYIVRCKLKEGSFVTLAADPDTNAIAAADQEREEVMKVLKSLSGIQIKAEGTAPAGTPAPAAPAPAAPAAIQAAAPVVPDVTVQLKAELDALREERRVEGCKRVCAGQPEIEAKAIAEKWTVEAAELATLRASRPSGVNVFIPANTQEMNADVYAAAVCQTCGLKSVEKMFDEKVMAAADKQFHGSIGLNQLLHMIAIRAGYTGDHYFRNNTSLRQALRASFSSNTLTSVISNVANKFIMEAYVSIEQVWAELSKQRTDVQDFKEYETYAKTTALRLQKLAPDGKIKHGTIGDEKYTNKLETFAIMLGIPRQAFINDDIGILSSLSSDFGTASGETLNEAWWAEFLDDAAFFTAGLGNLTSGAESAMSETSLKTGFTKFEGYTKTIGKEVKQIGLPAKYLLTGTALKFTAREWMTGATKVTGSTTPVISSNSLAGLAVPLVSRYITEATNWYLLADPARRPVMEVSFLRGKTKPTVEEVEPDSDMLGIQMRAYFDFGIKKQVPQGGLKVTGKA